MSATHALRDKWFFSYLPLLTSEMVNSEYKGDWELASQKRTVRLDWIQTVEELWSTMNSLPKIQSMPAGSTFILAREDKEASFESFPNGSRVVVSLNKSPATETGLEAIFAAVLGETISEELGVTVCDVLRLAARPSREFTDLVRVEVWLNDSAYSKEVSKYIRNLLDGRKLAPATYTITENPFDANKTKDKEKDCSKAKETDAKKGDDATRHSKELVKSGSADAMQASTNLGSEGGQDSAGEKSPTTNTITATAAAAPEEAAPSEEATVKGGPPPSTEENKVTETESTEESTAVAAE